MGSLVTVSRLLAAMAATAALALAGCPGRKAPPESAHADAHADAYAAPIPRPSAPSARSIDEPPEIVAVQREADGWRRDHRIIDMHQHIPPVAEALAHAVKLQDAVGVGLVVNLSGGTVTLGAEAVAEGVSAFAYTRALADHLYPGRFLQYMNLDYTDWDSPTFSRDAVKQIEQGAKLGAAGLKEYKRLGLYLRDGAKKLIRIDDPKLDPVWKRCGELDLPISIHVADPRAFWLPLDRSNERWDELKDHPSWWFGDPTKFPPRMELLEALDRVIGRHPETTFVSVHFGANAEDIAWVDAAMDRHPNMWIDLAARVPEIGRHDPAEVRRFFIKHQDKILFATDLSVGEELVLGSGGLGPPPTDADAVVFFQKHWRWLETRDVNFPHMTPIQGNWTISGIGLPADVLKKVYFENARRLLARSLPAGK
jgi:predicted TIM-barrel fold metal-dependent hydrolase